MISISISFLAWKIYEEKELHFGFAGGVYKLNGRDHIFYNVIEILQIVAAVLALLISQKFQKKRWMRRLSNILEVVFKDDMFSRPILNIGQNGIVRITHWINTTNKKIFHFASNEISPSIRSVISLLTRKNSNFPSYVIWLIVGIIIAILIASMGKSV
ncbi:MAG: hypothetical protein LBI95_02440 [Holosporales bacterium]|nr:hypothetical protein [Holosporales bacterium]